MTAEDSSWASVTSFLARQAHLFDEGKAHEWARTFVEDGVFSSPSHGDAFTGWSELERLVEDASASAIAAGERTCHLLGPSEIVSWTADVVALRSYLQLVATNEATGTARISRVVTCLDELRVTRATVKMISRTVIPVLGPLAG